MPGVLLLWVATPPAWLPGQCQRARLRLGHGFRRHLIQMSGLAGRRGHEVFAAENLPEQELREHVRLQRELAAVGGKGFDLAQDLFGYVEGDDALSGPHVCGRGGRVRLRTGQGTGQAGSGAPASERGWRCRGQDEAGEAGGGDHVAAAGRRLAMPSSPKNSPAPSRPSRSRRPRVLSCHVSASPDKIKNSSAEASPCSTTDEPGGYQRTWT